jgi:hypothetical protein
MSYGAPSEITLAREAASYKCRSRNLRHIYFQNEPRFRSRPRSRAVICECKKTNGAIAQRTLCTLPSGRAARRIGVNVQNKAKKKFLRQKKYLRIWRCGGQKRVVQGETASAARNSKYR